MERTTKIVRLTQVILLAASASLSHAETGGREGSDVGSTAEQVETRFIEQFAANLRRELAQQRFSVQEAAAATRGTVQRSAPAALKKLQWTGTNLNDLLVRAIQSGCVVKLESRSGQILAAGFEFWCP